jgi:hypothetical protein
MACATSPSALKKNRAANNRERKAAEAAEKSTLTPITEELEEVIDIDAGIDNDTSPDYDPGAEKRLLEEEEEDDALIEAPAKKRPRAASRSRAPSVPAASQGESRTRSTVCMY